MYLKYKIFDVIKSESRALRQIWLYGKTSFAIELGILKYAYKANRKL